LFDVPNAVPTPANFGKITSNTSSHALLADSGQNPLLGGFTGF